MISTLLYSIVNMLGLLGKLPPGLRIYMLVISTTIPVYILTPRFVMSIRQLYVLDTQGRCNADIDTGFGLSSRADRGVGGSTILGTIAFVEGGSGLNDGAEIIMMEERAESGSRQVFVT